MVAGGAVRKARDVPLPRRPLLALGLGLLVLVTALPLAVATATLRPGDTALLPGRPTATGYVVDGRPAEVSVALDVRNTGLLPVRVIGLAGSTGPAYDGALGRGIPGGGLPEEPRFAPFVLWPRASRLVVLHLRRVGAGGPLALDRVGLRTSTLGHQRVLQVRLPARVSVS